MFVSVCIVLLSFKLGAHARGTCKETSTVATADAPPATATPAPTSFAVALIKDLNFETVFSTFAGVKECVCSLA